MDPHPGFLNGILSLLLNSTGPQYAFSEQEQTAVAYFHRARAEELLRLFEAKFPQSRQRVELRAHLVEAYAAYGASDGVIRAARRFLNDFPKSRLRTQVSLHLAEAFARKGDTQNEFVTYDALLKELAASAAGVPIGETIATRQRRGSRQAPGEARDDQYDETVEQEPEDATPWEPDSSAPADRRAEPFRFVASGGAEPERVGPRSPDYARVLDRYISRLLALKRRMDALALLRRELDRNPNDPGLYERLAAFLQQNRLESEVEQVYKRAIQQFSTTSWYDKLGRWYLRRKYAGGIDRLTRQVVETFSGTDLEQYFASIVHTNTTITPQLYLSLNRYAHDRFPYNLAFVHNLVSAYSAKETYDGAAREALLRDYWSYDDELRGRYFSLLASTRRLNPELAKIEIGDPFATAQKNVAAVHFVAEAEIWRSHFEQAAAPLEAVASQFPGNSWLATSAERLDRSLAAFDPRYTDRAAAIIGKVYGANRRDRHALTEWGEIYADRELFARARPHWNALAELEPGQPEGYLEAATVFWDYFQYDDALRQLEAGRTRLGRPALYAYEAGAIYENKRDYARAVQEYIQGAEPGTSARARLITLARRPAHRALIDKATAERVAGPLPDPGAVSLRLAILDAQDRRADAEQFLLSLADRASSVDVLATVRGEGERRGLDAVTERALEREAAVTADPIERMRARLALMRFYEAKSDTARAQHTAEELYRDNPAILGIVRATVDFYWRNKMPRQAVEVLARAAAAANPALKPQFLLEAAAKAAESGDYTRAKDLAASLLATDPLKPAYVAAMADALARAGDDRALRAFYEDKIQAVRAAPLSADERMTRIAELRRGLIPVQTRLQDYTAATDQYIEIVKSYPEDEGLVREAAAYASEHSAEPRLRGYFQKAVADSPKDFRWPLVLARLETFFEDLPAAIDAYRRASGIRPERVDVHAARASLEERLLRFDDALQDYLKLYDLTYRNPSWMQKAAEIYARRGDRPAAVKALRVALIEGRPERPRPFFEAATTLEQWSYLPEARELAERGVVLAGTDLFTDYETGARLYARIMTRLRQHETAIDRLHGLGERGPERLGDVLEEIGRTIARYFTPEEKAAAEQWLDRAARQIPMASLLRLVQPAGLTALEARWRYELMMRAPGQRLAEAQVRPLMELQRSRLKFDELGLQLEAYWSVSPKRDDMTRLLADAARSFWQSGNAAAELRILKLYDDNGGLPQNLQPRYAELLVSLAPKLLLSEAARGNSETQRDFAARAAVESGNLQLALEAVRARGATLPPVWTRAYTGAVGLYYRDASPRTIGELASALGDAPIGDRLGRPVDRGLQLAGDPWFYYGTIYGEYLGLAKSGEAEDFLPALLEGGPAHADNYLLLANYYRDSSEAARALTDYEHVLELEPNRGAIQDRIAEVLWEQGKREEALARWKAAFQAFRRAEDQRLQVTFWGDVQTALEHVGARNLLPELRSEADAVLRTYIRRNGSYGVEPLIEGALAAAGGSPDGAAWLLDLGRAAQDPLALFQTILNSKRLTDAQREVFLRRGVEIATAEAARPGPERASAQEHLYEWQTRTVEFLLLTKQADRAQAVLAEISKSLPSYNRDAVDRLEIRVAAQAGRLPALLARYSAKPADMPRLETLHSAAADLKKAGDAASARRLLEFVYTRELDSRNFAASNFLGLAEVRLEEGDLKGALGLLRRMTLVAGEPFEDLMPAAALLEKTGHAAEAREFLTARAKAVPWDMEARARLGDLAAARSPEAPYEVRVVAARLAGGTNLGSAELDLLAARAPIPPQAAEQPLFYHARLRAAGETRDSGLRMALLRGAIGIQPEPKQPRLDLFRAALASRSWHVAMAAMLPFTERWRYESERAEQEPGSDFGMLSGDYPAPERLEIVRGLAEANLNLGRLQQALYYYTGAAGLEPSAQITARVDEIKAEQQRRREDARRRPLIQSGLMQDHLVRPRLIPSTQLQGGLPR